MGVIHDSIKSHGPRGRLKLHDAITGGISDALTDLRVAGRSVIDEAWPGTAVSTLAQWHETKGVKYDPLGNADDQRAYLVALESGRGGSNLLALQAQIQRLYPDLTVEESSASSECGEAECGVALCGADTDVLDSTSYVLVGTIDSSVDVTRLADLLARFAPAHTVAVSRIETAVTDEYGEVGSAECGLSECWGDDGTAYATPSFASAAFIAGTAELGSWLYAYPGLVAGSPTPSLTYQWRRNGVDISGATSSLYFVTVDASYTCRVTATNSQGSASSTSSAIATPHVAPTLVSGPSTYVTTSALFAVATFAGYPTPVVTYQWRRNGVDLSGKTMPSIDLSAPSQPSAGTLTCVITATNDAGSKVVTTSPVVVGQPSITWSSEIDVTPISEPSAYRLRPSTITVTATPPATLAYQWYRDGVAYATTSEIVVDRVSSSYYLVVTATNSYGPTSKTSETVTT